MQFCTNKSLATKPRITFTRDSARLFIEIETERLFIRSYTDDDFENCCRLYADEKITKHFDHGKGRTREEVHQLVQKRGKDFFDAGKPFGLFSLFEKNTNIFIGQIDLLPMNESGVYEVGCILFQQFQNQRYSVEALKSCIEDYVNFINSNGFGNHIDRVSKVVATVHPENDASQKMILNLGMTFEKSLERFGAPRDWYAYIPNQKESDFSHSWKAEEYHHHSSIQFEAASKLLDQIQLKGNEQILDIGCGDGKITAKIAERLSSGSILGIDFSKEMIHFAETRFPLNRYPRLKYAVQDAVYLPFVNQFDLVFSSFAIQWMKKDFKTFFTGVNRCLKSTGYFAATIPLGISSALEEAIHQHVTDSKWVDYFHDFNCDIKLTSADEYAQFLDLTGFIPTHFRIVEQEKKFASRKDLEEYILQWFCYLKPIPDPLKECFFDGVIDRYLELEPSLVTGEVLFKFPRLDVIAFKIPNFIS